VLVSRAQLQQLVALTNTLLEYVEKMKGATGCV